VLKTALQFKPLTASLSFIKNKRKWAMSFMGRGLVEIPQQDYEIIISAAK
jgi:predicted RNA-binding protein